MVWRPAIRPKRGMRGADLQRTNAAPNVRIDSKFVMTSTSEARMFNGLSRRHFGRLAGWSTLGISTKSAEAIQADPGGESRLANGSRSADFPSGFLWGTATSAYQIEGAVNEDGRGPSVWDRFAHTRGAIADNSNADIACDHYHLYRQDVQLI